MALPTAAQKIAAIEAIIEYFERVGIDPIDLHEVVRHITGATGLSVLDHEVAQVLLSKGYYQIAQVKFVKNHPQAKASSTSLTFQGVASAISPQGSVSPYTSMGTGGIGIGGALTLTQMVQTITASALGSGAGAKMPKKKVVKKKKPTEKVEVGSKVLLSRDSEFAHQVGENEVGEVIGQERVQGRDWCMVKWESNSNNYPKSDLILLTPGIVKKGVTMDSVILPQEKKDEINAAISQLHHHDTIFTKWGFSDVFEKGTAISLLFWGVPGTGKTLCAQAIADSFEAELQIYGTAEIQSPEPGGAERTMKELFAKAKKKNKDGKRQVILFDECDSLLTDRNEVGPILGAQVNTLLTELERYEGIIIFTTNRLGKLDAALERRIAAKIEFPFPNEEARLSIWRRMIPKKAPLAKDVDFPTLATYVIAGGNIKNAVLNAARRAAYEKSKEITMNHFVLAAEKEVLSVKAFLKEYKKQNHQSQVGYVNRTGTSLKVTETMETKVKTAWGGETV